MSRIHELAIAALQAGWLSLEVEQQITELFDTDSGWCVKDLETLSELQRAVSDGRVKREAIGQAHILSNPRCYKGI